jgi:putative transposase
VWDISWLPSCVRGQFFYLYLVLDLYSRKIVAAEVFEAESGRWASELIHRAVLREGCINAPPVLHADNGAPMKGRTLQATLDWLGIERSFSRPRTCNDNAYAEATFRTLKYRPHWPVHGFDCLQAAREWVESFLSWYNQSHRHSALRYVTPQQRHAGEDRAILEARSQLYRRARDQHPERWSGPIRDWSPIGPVTLNSTGRAPAQVLQSS